MPSIYSTWHMFTLYIQEYNTHVYIYITVDRPNYDSFLGCLVVGLYSGTKSCARRCGRGGGLAQHDDILL